MRNRKGAGEQMGGSQGRYLVGAVQRACDLLHAFRFEGELLRLSDLAARTGLSQATTLRILRTLEAGDLIQRVDKSHYRSNIRPVRRARYRIGYASQSAEFAFTRDVTDSIIRAAENKGIDLIVLNNRYSSRMALRNAEHLVAEKVDLAIEFQTDEQIAPVISSKFAEARIPLLALEIPHPGAVYYGADNYNAGRLGGRALGKWARLHWQGKAEEIILLELSMAGPVPHSRLTGMLAGIQEILPQAGRWPVVYLDGNGQFEKSLTVCRQHLAKRHPQRTLVGAINDPSALGALRAFEEAGRSEFCVVMGQNASAEARAELRRQRTRMAGSVAYFPEKYGEAVVNLAVNILEKKRVPPAVFVRHRLITAENVNRYYPNDVLLGDDTPDALLFHSP